MNTKKFNLNWQSVLFGMVLCMVLVVFMGSKPADAQAGAQQRYQQQRAVNLNDVWEKLNDLDARVIAMDQRLVSMDGKLNHLQASIDQWYKESNRQLNRIEKAQGK